MKTEKKYSVYGHVNITNGKWYVGMTSREPKKRFNYGFGYQRNLHMWEDIQESDWNKDWIHTVFDTFDNREDALDYEAFLIGMFDTIENGYNTSSYSSGTYKRSEESKKKSSEARTGEKNPMFGKHHSEEIRKKLSDSKPKNPVLQFTKDGEFIAEYSSIMEAERKTGCNNGHICECCKGKRKQCGGYHWQYA